MMWCCLFKKIKYWSEIRAWAIFIWRRGRIKARLPWVAPWAIFTEPIFWINPIARLHERVMNWRKGKRWEKTWVLLSEQEVQPILSGMQAPLHKKQLAKFLHCEASWAKQGSNAYSNEEKKKIVNIFRSSSKKNLKNSIEEEKYKHGTQLFPNNLLLSKLNNCNEKMKEKSKSSHACAIAKCFIISCLLYACLVWITPRASWNGSTTRFCSTCAFRRIWNISFTLGTLLMIVNRRFQMFKL